MCYFTAVQFPETTGYVDLRPWMDSTPITLSHSSSMQIAVQLFEKLVRPILSATLRYCLLQGLRYVLLTSRGYLMGLITKKDVIRNMAALEEEDEEAAGDAEGREFAGGYQAQESGLLNDDEDERRRSRDS